MSTKFTYLVSGEPFRFWCQKVLPLVYDDSLSYYEVLSKVVKSLNLHSSAIEEIQQILDGSGVDIDEAVQKVLDAIEADGSLNQACTEALNKLIDSGAITEATLSTINKYVSDGNLDGRIESIANTTAETVVEEAISNLHLEYDTLTSIPSTLTIGTYVTTKGYSTVNDGGSGDYIVASSGLPMNGLYVKPVKTESFKSYGLVGDGVTNDTNALQRYINLSKDVDLANGSFIISSTITLHSNLTITGDGCNITLNNNLSGNGFELDEGSDVSINGIKFNGGSPATYRKIISITNSTRISITDCEFTLGYGYAIRFSNSDSSVLRNNFFYNINGETGDPGGGFYCQGIHDVIFEGTRGDDLRDHLIYIDGSVECYDITIKNTECSNTKSNPLTSAGVIAIYGNAHDFTIINTRMYNTRSGITVNERNSQAPHDYVIDTVFGVTELETVAITHDSSSVAPYKKANAIVSNVICNSSIEDGLMIRYLDSLVVTNVLLVAIARNGVGIDYCSNVNVFNVTSIGNVANVIVIGSRGAVEKINVKNVHVSGNGSDVIILKNNATNCLVEDVIYNGNYTRVTQNHTSTPIRNLNITPSKFSRSVFSADSIPSGLSQFNNYSQVGDKCLDSTGATNGWICTAAGNPGTWTAIS